MQLVDSHCHLDLLDLSPFDDDLQNCLLAAEKNGVAHVLCAGTSLKHFERIHRIAKQHANVSCSVGVHPHNDEREVVDVDQLAELAASPEVVAIGETGLDYHYTHDSKDNQQVSFRRQIQAARRVNKPLIVHSRDAIEDTLGILKNEQAMAVGGVMHCFTYDWACAKRVLDLGFSISISGIVTFKKAMQVHEVAKKIPLESLLIETDAPFLAPIPFRGKQNQPSYVLHVAEYIAQLRGISLEALAEATTANFYHLFTGASQ
jgi:TatD DNase family protein